MYGGGGSAGVGGGGGEGELMAGWLVKSPPLDNKKPIFKPVTPKWRRRWFVLREGGMPRQYILNYYTDQTARKLKGSIDLDECFQVDSGLTYNCGKVWLANLFNITTQKRIYYLSADTVQEMNAWVQSLCQACGLRPFQVEEDEEAAGAAQEAAPGGQQHQITQETGGRTSQISGPYMHLSECFTGSGANGSQASHVRRMSGNGRKEFMDASSSNFRSSEVSSPDVSLNVGDDSVFLPNSPKGKQLGVSAPPPPPHSMDDVSNQFSSLKVGGLGGHQNPHQPPHRPPKPAGLRNQTGIQQSNAGETYENLQNAQKIAQTARQQQQQLLLQQQQQKNQKESNNNNQIEQPHSSLPPPPPQVNRQLKPSKRQPVVGSSTLPAGNVSDQQRKQSTSSHLHNQFDTLPASEPRHGMHIPGQPADRFGTIVDRTSSMESVNSRRNSEEEETIYFYMPSLPKTGDGRWDIMIPAQDMIGQSIEYLDLDLPSPHTNPTDQPPTKEARPVEDPSTVYKTVDFIKTEAFNKTKKNVEHSRYNIQQS